MGRVVCSMVRVECKFWLCVCFVCALPFARGTPWETELLRGVKIRHSDAIALGRDAESQATRARHCQQSERVCDSVLPIKL
jgi:hypothetical protein